ncbi:hypothetical protein RHMOL_Rhmol07G0302800 [Rhododendron molle]|uniref:Uncharacterized protein n=1 Tax=Rhododendron molle TaxID=49168 RepID=A0ACC0N810_RHOML|nr:hypothetical protein RHMOL_Rhmol07G0302800 [Rhododendron molle]
MLRGRIFWGRHTLTLSLSLLSPPLVPIPKPNSSTTLSSLSSPPMADRNPEINGSETNEPSPKIQKLDQNGVRGTRNSVTNPFLKVKKLSEKAVLPSRASPLSAGYDLSSAAEIKVPARGKALVPTDLSIAIPEGTYARIVQLKYPKRQVKITAHLNFAQGATNWASESFRQPKINAVGMKQMLANRKHPAMLLVLKNFQANDTGTGTCGVRLHFNSAWGATNWAGELFRQPKINALSVKHVLANWKYPAMLLASKMFQANSTSTQGFC